MEPEDTGDAVGEPAGEHGADDTEQVVEERDDLCNNESEGPDGNADTNPGQPSCPCMRGHVPGMYAIAPETTHSQLAVKRVNENDSHSDEYQFGADVSIDDTGDHDRRQRNAIRNLSECRSCIAEGGRHGIIADERVYNDTDDEV